MRADRLGFAILLFILCTGAVLVDAMSVEPFGPVKDLPLMVGGLLLLPWVVWVGRAGDFLRTGIGRGMLALLAVAGLSAMGAINPPAAREEMLRLFCLALVAVAALRIEWTQHRLGVLGLLVLLGAGANSIFVLAEHFDWSWKLYTRENRLLGFFSHQNDLAQFLSIAILMGFVVGTIQEGVAGYAPTLGNRPNNLVHGVGAQPAAPSMTNAIGWITTPILALMALSSVALVLTLSRGAWLGTFAGLGHLLWCRGGAGKRMAALKIPLLMLVFGISLGAILLGSDSMAKANTSPLKTKSDLKTLMKDSGRREIYTHSLHAFLEAPILGSGPGNFPVIYQKTDRTRTEYVRYAHSDPLQWLVETGMVGGLVALGLGWVLWRRMRNAEGTVRVVAATLVATAVHSLVSYPFYKAIPAAWAFWAMGVLGKGALRCAPTDENMRDGNSSGRALSAVGAHRNAPFMWLAAIISILLLPTVLAPWRASRIQKVAFAPFQSPPTLPQDAVVRHRQVADGLEKARELQPHDPAILWSLAISRLQGGEPSRAEAVLGELQTLTPFNDRVHLLLAQLAAARGDQATRLAFLERAFEVIPNSRPLLDELWVMLEWPGITGKESRRITLMNAYKNQGWWREREPELLAELGDTASLQDLVHAQVILADRLLVDSGQAENLARLGLTQFRLGDISAALESYRKALGAIDASSVQWGQRPDLLLRVLMAQGNCLMQLRQIGEALPLFTRGRKSFPREPRFLEQELRILMEGGKWSEIGKVVEEAAGAHGDQRKIRLRAAGLLESWEGGGEVALLEALEQHHALVKTFNDGQAYLGRGRFYIEKMKDAGSARADLEEALARDLEGSLMRETEALLQSLR